MDWLFGEEEQKQPSAAGGDVQESVEESGPNLDFESLAPAADIVENDNASTESEIEEFTPSKVLEKPKENVSGGLSVSVSLTLTLDDPAFLELLIRLRYLNKIDSDGSDGPIVEVNAVSPPTEMSIPKTIFDEYDDSAWKSQLLITEGIVCLIYLTPRYIHSLIRFVLTFQ